MPDRASQWLPKAVRDLQRAVDWYAAQDDGPRLVARFEAAVAREVEHVMHGPERWPIVRDRYRQKLFSGAFPYALVYRVSQDSVVIVALAHQRRRPGHWAGR